MIAAADRRSSIHEDLGDLLAEAAVRDGDTDADGGADRDEHREVNGFSGGGGIHTLQSDHHDGGEPGRDDRGKQACCEEEDHRDEDGEGDPGPFVLRKLGVADRG